MPPTQPFFIILNRKHLAIDQFILNATKVNAKLLWTDERIEQRRIIVIVACWGMQITRTELKKKKKPTVTFHVKSHKRKKMHVKAVREIYLKSDPSHLLHSAFVVRTATSFQINRFSQATWFHHKSSFAQHVSANKSAARRDKEETG